MAVEESCVALNTSCRFAAKKTINLQSIVSMELRTNQHKN